MTPNPPVHGLPAAAGRERIRLRIAVNDTDPEIWRLVDVDGALRLDELHDIIQLAFGWRGHHLHEFTDTDPQRIPLRDSAQSTPGAPGAPAPVARDWVERDRLDEARDDARFDEDLPSLRPRRRIDDEHDATVASVFDSGAGPLWYWYDFGDDWWHRIELIEREPIDAADASEPPFDRTAELVRGNRRGPLDDSGGPHGYAELVERLAHPVPAGAAGSEAYAGARSWADYVAWPDARFDAESFDAASVDRELALRFDLASDLSRLIVAGEPAAAPPDAPVVKLLQRLPPPHAAAMRVRLRSCGALERSDALAEPTARAAAATTTTAAIATRPFAWLLETVGADGLQLTKAGWMPPATVLEGMTVLGWRDDWIGEANREDHTAPMFRLREAAQRLRLVRLLKGRLVRTPAGRRVDGDPVALLRHLMTESVSRAYSPAAADAAVLFGIELACGDRGLVFSAAVAAGKARPWRGVELGADRLGWVATGLDMLGWAMRSGDRPTARDAEALLDDLTDLLRTLSIQGLGAAELTALQREVGRGLLGAD